MKKWRRLAAWAQARWGKLAVLAERGARVWAAHWVLIVGSFLVFCSVLLKWVEFPLSQNLSGLQLPLLRNVGLIAHVYLLSFGVLGIGVLITGLVLLRLSGPLLALASPPDRRGPKDTADHSFCKKLPPQEYGSR